MSVITQTQHSDNRRELAILSKSGRSKKDDQPHGKYNIDRQRDLRHNYMTEILTLINGVVAQLASA